MGRKTGRQRLSPESNGQDSPRVEAQAAGLEISSTLEKRKIWQPHFCTMPEQQDLRRQAPGQAVGI